MTLTYYFWVQRRIDQLIGYVDIKIKRVYFFNFMGHLDPAPPCSSFRLVI